MNKLTLAIVRVSRSHQDWTLQLDAINKVIKERNLTPVQWEDFTEKREAYLNQDKPLCVDHHGKDDRTDPHTQGLPVGVG